MELPKSPLKVVLLHAYLWSGLRDEARGGTKQGEERGEEGREGMKEGKGGWVQLQESLPKLLPLHLNIFRVRGPS